MRTYRAICACLLFCCSAALFFATPAFGVCFLPNPTVTCEFLDSDAVFIGTVVSMQNTPAQGDEFDEGWTYEMSVQKMYRGPHGKTIKVFTENNSARFPLETGREYILFATKIQGRFEIFGCGNSALLSEAGNTIKELDKVKIRPDAEIEGRISFSGIPDTGTHVSGVHVVIQGEGKTYTAISDRDGWFHLHVPPGKYSAKAQPVPHWSISPFDLSSDDPQQFVAAAGRCADLQFIADTQ